MARTRIVIVGGGYAGAALAPALEEHADVILVEARECFVHNVAAIRGVVDPDVLSRAVLPYGRLLKRGKVIHDRVVALGDSGVRLANGDEIEADIVVVATGSSYAQPFKPAGDSVADFLASSRQAHELLQTARSVAIAGAGAVGAELAGEIATKMPDKSVTLVTPANALFPDYQPGFGRKLDAQLRELGVVVRYGVTAALTQNSGPYSGDLAIQGGEAIASDLVFPATGARAVVELFKPLLGVAFDRLGRVQVDSWLRPAGRSRLFALGDAVATGDAMTIVGIHRQAAWLIKTLRAVLGGTEADALPQYAAWPMPPILIPFGPKKGASILPITRKGLIVGAHVTSALKGKDLFIPRYRKDFGHGQAAEAAA